METTIRLNNAVKEKLDTLKIHHRESYNELISRLVESSSPANSDRESLIETIEVLSDPETMRKIAEAIERVNSGNYGIPLEDVKKELGID